MEHLLLLFVCRLIHQSKDEYELTTKTTCLASFARQMKLLLPQEQTNLRWEILWASHLINRPCFFFYPSPLSPWYWLSWLATILLDSSLKALTQKNWAFLLYPNIWIERNGSVNYFILIWSKKTSVGWYGSEQEVITVASNNSKSNCYFLPQLRPRTLDNFIQFSKYISLIYSRCLCSSRRHVVKVGYDWDHFSYLWRILPK